MSASSHLTLFQTTKIRKIPHIFPFTCEIIKFLFSKRVGLHENPGKKKGGKVLFL